MATDGFEYDVAIVGMAGRFPGARNIEEFWRNVVNGVESIAHFSDDALRAAGVAEAVVKRSDYVKAAPVLDEPGHFDAAFFGYSPAEARVMDPQHRLLLELAQEALDDAGCDPDRFPGHIGVFAGTAMNTYFANSELRERFAEEYIPTLIGNDKDFLSTRISYKLNLRGPSLTVQSACSTSMVAVHLARQSLLSEESDVALAGAVSVRVPHEAGYFSDGGGVVSPDGHVRPFDASANGTVFGSGGGVLVLKRLKDAIAAGDSIYAVIKGSAVNNDGALKAGYTAPSVQGQADVVLEALGNAGVDADSIGYIEAHGSGTRVGDPIEVAALTQAFRALTTRSGFCAIGSVKANVGHLDAAAAVTGLIKTALAVKHGVIPPSLNFTAPNPEIDFSRTPFYVNTQRRLWQSAAPRRAGVMSTGMGGTNAHVILEEAPAMTTGAQTTSPQLLVLSAKTATALTAATAQLGNYLKVHDVPLGNVAHTLQTGRREFAWRRCVVCHDRDDAVRLLSTEFAKCHTEQASDDARPVVFLLPGIGDHYVGMARDLYEQWPVFRAELDHCATIIHARCGIDIRDVLYPRDGAWQQRARQPGLDLKAMLGRKDDAPDPDSARLNETRVAQPALFAVEYALCRLWQSIGVTPNAIIGHSMGEYVAATLAGVFSLEDALRLIVRRAQLVSALPAGAMLAVPLSERDLAPLLPNDVSIALINGPELCVIAGPSEAISACEQELSGRGVITRRVENRHAFHSRMIDPIVGALEREVQGITLHAPAIPFTSNVSGTWITDSEATDPAYWAAHANHTSRFADALHAMWQLEVPLLIEAGPGRTLGVLALQHPARPDGATAAIPSLRHHYDHQSDADLFLGSIGRAWTSGVHITWDALPSREGRRKVSLPSYPFERQRYWLASSAAREGVASPSVALRKTANPAEWLYAPSWKRGIVNAVAAGHAGERAMTWLVFADDVGVSARVVKELESEQQRVVVVHAGDRYAQRGPRSFVIRAGDDRDYGELVGALVAGKLQPDRILHAWSLSPVPPVADQFAYVQNLGFYSLIHLARALAAQNVDREIRLFALSDSVHEVVATETLAPEKATMLGPCIVIPQEYPNIRVTNVDLDPALSGTDATAEAVLRELHDPEWHNVVAYRNGQRWLQMFEPIRSVANGPAVLRDRGVYLITGGTGRVASAIAIYLAEQHKARLVLVGRTRPLDDRTAERIATAGGEVLVLHADVADLAAMQRVFAETYRRFGTLHGVFHAAGVAGPEGIAEIQSCTREQYEPHFTSKAIGARVIETILDGKHVDFCMLVSSMAAILGGVGEAAYAAANAYLDAFARAHNRRSRVPWLSVNWDIWRLGPGRDDAGAGTTVRELGTTAEEGTGLLEDLLKRKATGQILISTGDLESRLNQWVRLQSLHGENRGAATVEPTGDADETGEGALDETERRIADIWKRALGLPAVDRHDSFARLGGHSLLAVSIVGELRRTFQLDLPIRVMFDAPTIADLAQYIRAQLIAEIDALSDEAAERLVSTS